MNIKEMKDLLEKASDAYYNSDEKIMSDEEYDKLRDKYENEVGLLPIGALPKEGKGTVNVSHNYENMVGSLSKTNTIEGFREWLEKTITNGKGDRNKIQLLVSLKYDGNSVAIEYENGKCKLALTRGRDGKGLDLTHVFKDETIPVKDNLCVKYEVVMCYDDFNQFLEDTGGDYKNPRSVTAGILGRDDAYKYRKYLTLVPLAVALENEEFSSKNDELKTLKKVNTGKVKYHADAKLLKGNLEEVIEQLEDIYNNLSNTRQDLNVMIDGLVIELIGKKYHKLGYVNTKPKWVVALKFPYMEKTSKVTGFDFCLGNSGRITPRVWFEPVVFNGATQQKVSLANYMRFQELKLGIGSDILVQYRNDCLSYVEKLDTEHNKTVTPYEFTNVCPVCGSPVEINDNGTYAFCSNPNCNGTVIGRIERYLTKLDIKGIKAATLEKLYDNNMITDIHSLYELDYKKVAKIEGLGTKSANIMKKAIESKVPFDYELLAGIGIEDLGNTMSKQLCKVYSLTELLDLSKKKSFKNEIIKLEGFSDIMAGKLLYGLNTYRDELNKLIKCTNMKIYKESLVTPTGKTYNFCITGSINQWKNRDELKSVLESLGHKVTGGVTSKTDYLINNDLESTSSKNKKAKELNKLIINEQQLKELLGL